MSEASHRAITQALKMKLFESGIPFYHEYKSEGLTAFESRRIRMPTIKPARASRAAALCRTRLTAARVDGGIMAGPSRPPKREARHKPAGRALILHLSEGVVRRARDGMRGRAVRGSPAVLLAEEEAMLVKKILQYAERGALITGTMLQSAVASYVNRDLL